MTKINILNNKQWVLDEDINPESGSYDISHCVSPQINGANVGGLYITFGNDNYIFTSEMELNFDSEIGEISGVTPSGMYHLSNTLYKPDYSGPMTFPLPSGIESEIVDGIWGSGSDYLFLRRGTTNSVIWADSEGVIEHEVVITDGIPLFFIGVPLGVVYIITSTHKLFYDDYTHTLSSSTALSGTLEEMINDDTFITEYFAPDLLLDDFIFSSLGFTEYLAGISYQTTNTWYFIKEESGIKYLQKYTSSGGALGTYELAYSLELPDQDDDVSQIVIYNNWSPLSRYDFYIFYEDKVYTYYQDYETEEWSTTNYVQIDECSEVGRESTFMDSSKNCFDINNGDLWESSAPLSDFVRFTPNYHLICTDRALLEMGSDSDHILEFGTILEEEDVIEIASDVDNEYVVLTTSEVMHVVDGVVTGQQTITSGTPFFMVDTPYDPYIFTTSSYYQYNKDTNTLTLQGTLPAFDDLMMIFSNYFIILNSDTLNQFNIFEGSDSLISNGGGQIFSLAGDTAYKWGISYDPSYHWEETEIIPLPNSDVIAIRQDKYVGMT